MRISKSIKPPAYEINIIAYRDVFQSESSLDRFGDAYKDKSAVITMDIDDMGRINVKEGENVEIYNENGHVIATVRKSTHHPGLAFMPSSFYSNMLADEEGNIRANVSRTEEKTVDLKGLMGGFVRIE